MEQMSDISTTSNGQTPTPLSTPTDIHNGVYQSVNSIAQPNPAGVPSVHGSTYGYNQWQQNEKNAGTRPRKISCYNCGSSGHLGPECPEETMEQMLDTLRRKRKSQKNLTTNGEKTETRPKEIPCANCGSPKHSGFECAEKTLEEILYVSETFRMKFRSTDYECQMQL